MSSEKRTIQFNPELLKMNNKTRKAKNPKIELRSELKAQKQKTLRKNVLKMIREKQQDAYRELFDKKKPTSSQPPAVKEFNKDFDESVNFFSSLATKVETTPANHTFKNVSSISPSAVSSSFSSSLPSVSLSPPTDFSPSIRILPSPQYGCLKNGALPTFRTYTRKNNPMQEIPMQERFVQEMPVQQSQLQERSVQQSQLQESHLFDTPLLTRPFPTEIPFRTEPLQMTDRFTQQKEMDRKFDKLHTTKTNQKLRYKKRKKIFRRTYRVGRSTTSPVIGVLVSNKTIRSRISTEAQLLKQTPIQDVRKFLIKKGLVKVGTNAPNDVLRKMYETVSLVCGEIQNHNPENLLYNFIHDKE